MMKSVLVKLASKLCCLMLVLSMFGPVWADTAIVAGTDPDVKMIKGRFVTPDEVIDGELVIKGDSIFCIASSCAKPAGAAVFTVTNAYIFPGLIDAHNHIEYNIFPKWAPPRNYLNRYEWQKDPIYEAQVKAPHRDLTKNKNLSCEMCKYAEVKALISGVTTIQGSPDKECLDTLIRNAENQNGLNLPANHIRTKVTKITDWTKQDGDVNFDITKSFIVHLGEGTDESSLQEFCALKEKQLLTKHTVIIHGTAFGESEFNEMSQVGAKLIWSPQSNLTLYNKTTNVKLAIQKGVEVSVGVDWNPTGGNNIFDELRVAEAMNEREFDNFIPQNDWIEMITVKPAKALALENYIGKLNPGLKADITVLKSKDPDYAKSLLKNDLEDVEMVWVGGRLLYGDKDIVDKVSNSACDPLLVHGAEKLVCVQDRNSTVPKANQTLPDVVGTLQKAYPGLAPLAP